jgi:hypothetical protein
MLQYKVHILGSSQSQASRVVQPSALAPCPALWLCINLRIDLLDDKWTDLLSRFRNNPALTRRSGMNVQQRKVNKEKKHSKSTILLKQIILRLLIGLISFLIFPTLAVLSGLNYPNSLTFTTNFRLFSIPVIEFFGSCSRPALTIISDVVSAHMNWPLTFQY